MITIDQLNLMEESLRTLYNAPDTFDQSIYEPFYAVKQALDQAVNKARGDFLTQSRKTPQIEELPLCPLCEDHEATESTSDHLFGVLMDHEEAIERDDRICKDCHKKWSEGYQQESVKTVNERRGWFPKYEPCEKWDDVLYEGAIEPDSQQQQDIDIRSQLH